MPAQTGSTERLVGASDGRTVRRSARRTRGSSWLRQPTTWIAVVVLVAAVVVAVTLAGGSGSGHGDPAATVGSIRISDAEVAREVAAINAEPEYSSALSAASTTALAAPVSPQALASVGGDPDDLRINLAPVGGASSQRRYTDQDLKASVLTRQIYVAVVRQVLAGRHVEPTAAELAEGRQQASYESGEDSAGRSLFDRLPGWYQQELAVRGADIEALTRSEVGTGGVTAAQVTSAYRSRAATDFTTVCLRSARSADPAALAPGSAQAHDDGCAPMGDWATDVQAAIRGVAAGRVAPPLHRAGAVALVEVVSRHTAPLSAVSGNVQAVLSSRYTDAINTIVEDQLALTRVTVAARYGTYEDAGPVHGVVPPDALTPPPAGGPTTPVQHSSGPQQFDPFE